MQRSTKAVLWVALALGMLVLVWQLKELGLWAAAWSGGVFDLSSLPMESPDGAKPSGEDSGSVRTSFTNSDEHTCQSIRGVQGRLMYDGKRFQCHFENQHTCTIPQSGDASKALCTFLPTEHPGWVEDIPQRLVKNPPALFSPAIAGAQTIAPLP